MALRKSVVEQDEDLVRSRVEDGVDANNKQSYKGCTPLGIAGNTRDAVGRINPPQDASCEEEVERRRVRIIEMLMEAGANCVNASTKSGYTALYRAVDSFGVGGVDLDVVKSLLKHGCDVNSVDHYAMSGLGCYQESVLHLALKGSSDCREDLVKLLLEHGANPRLRDSYGWTPVEYYLLSYADDDRDGCWLEHRGINPGLLRHLPLSDLGMTLLHEACVFNEYSFVRELATAPDANVNALDRLGNTPLLYAVATVYEDTDADEEEQREIVKLLLCLGANANLVYTAYRDEEMTSINIADFLWDTTGRGKRIHSVLLQHAAIVAQLNDGEEFPASLRASDYMFYGHADYHSPKKEWRDCLSELKETKRYFVDTGVSFYDLLIADSCQSEIYAKHKRIVRAVEDIFSKETFPIYRDWISHTNFGMAVEHQKLLNITTMKLSGVLSFSAAKNAFFLKALTILDSEKLKMILSLDGVKVEDIVGYSTDSIINYYNIL